MSLSYIDTFIYIFSSKKCQFIAKIQNDQQAPSFRMATICPTLFAHHALYKPKSHAEWLKQIKGIKICLSRILTLCLIVI